MTHKTVPRSPTPEMIEAWHVADAKLQSTSFATYVPAIWQAMYDAAPQPTPLDIALSKALFPVCEGDASREWWRGYYYACRRVESVVGPLHRPAQIESGPPEAPQPTLAAPQEEPRQPSGGSAKLTFTLREAQTLVETFGGDDSMVTVRHLPSGAVASDKHNIDDGGPSPAGLWVHFTEYPEEGCMYLGPGDEVNDDPPAPQPTLAAPLDSAVTDWLRRAREAGSGLQSMLDIDGAELLLRAFSEQRECDRIDLADARGTIKRQETALADAYRQGAAAMREAADGMSAP